MAGARSEVTKNVTEAAVKDSQAVWLTLKKADPSSYFSSVNKTSNRKWPLVPNSSCLFADEVNPFPTHYSFIGNKLVNSIFSLVFVLVFRGL